MIRKVYSIVFVIFLILLFSVAAYEALSFQRLASYFPLYISLIGAGLSIYVLYFETRNLKHDSERQIEPSSTMSYFSYIAWMLFFVACIYLVGLPIASGIFLLLFLRYEAHQSYISIVISVLGVVGVLIGFAELMNLNYPRSLFTIIDI